MKRLNNHGRKIITTCVPGITRENILEVLESAYAVHAENSTDIDFLIKYEAGEQPLNRTKTYRSDINFEDVDNVANEVTEFKRGFHWGNPITLVQSDAGESKDVSEGIALLNKQYVLDGTQGKMQEIGRYVEICGVGYEYVDINYEYDPHEENNLFAITALDPRYTFIVRSNYYVDKRVMLGVTFSQYDDKVAEFTAFTPTDRYDVRKTGDNWKLVDHSLNPYGVIPIIEWVRSCDRTGCFERQIPAIDILNVLWSDFANDVDQNTQAIWHGNDVKLPTDENGNEIRPKSCDWLMTVTQENGKQPFVKPLSIAYDYEGILQCILSKRMLILQKCNVPQRNDNSGGSTGIAMSDATGWTGAEMVAAGLEPLQVASKLREVKVVLRILQRISETPEKSPLLALKVRDVQPNIKRQKTYEMTTKINALATGITHGIDPLHMIKTVNLFEDPSEVYRTSRKMIEKYQLSIVEGKNEAVGGNGKAPNKGRLSPDQSDQIVNSPVIDKTERGANMKQKG